jgi:hypothetical protein
MELLSNHGYGDGHGHGHGVFILATSSQDRTHKTNRSQADPRWRLRQWFYVLLEQILRDREP